MSWQEDRAVEAVHAIVAADRPKQEEEGEFFPYTLGAGGVNIRPTAMGAAFKSNS